MPENFKLTMVFDGPGCGWTESFYKGGATSPTDLFNLANQAGTGIVAARRGCLTAIYKIKALRCSNVDRPRDGLVVPFTAENGAGRQEVGPRQFAIQNEQVDDAANLRLYNGTSIWRTYPVRGLPNTAFTANGELATGGVFIPTLNNYIGAIKAGQWCLRQSVKGAPVVLVGVRMQNQQIFEIETSAAVPDAALTGALEIKDGYGLANVNGRYRITQIVDATHYRVIRRQRLSFGTLVANTGVVRAINYTYPIIDRGAIAGAMTRKTGRPLDESPGRARVRRS